MNSQDYRNLQEAYLDVYEQEITLKGTGPRLVDPYADSGESKSGGKMKGPKMKNVIKKEEFESWVNSLLEEGYDLSDYTWDELYENYTQLDEAIRNLESRKKLRSIMDREVVKGDESKGQYPRMKYHTKKGDQALDLLMKRDETGSKGNPVRSRGGRAPDIVGPTRDR